MLFCLVRISEVFRQIDPCFIAYSKLYNWQKYLDKIIMNVIDATISSEGNNNNANVTGKTWKTTSRQSKFNFHRLSWNKRKEK